MKMIITIVKDDEAEKIIQSLTSNKYRVTRIASTGGLFRKGNTTLLSGVEDELVEDFIQNVRKCVSSRTPNEKILTLFVIPVDRYERI